MLTANSLKSDSWFTCALSIIGSGCWYFAARSMRVQSNASWPALPVLSGSMDGHGAPLSLVPASETMAEPPAPERSSEEASLVVCPPDEPADPDPPPGDIVPEVSPA